MTDNVTVSQPSDGIYKLCPFNLYEHQMTCLIRNRSDDIDRKEWRNRALKKGNRFVFLIYYEFKLLSCKMSICKIISNGVLWWVSLSLLLEFRVRIQPKTVGIFFFHFDAMINTFGIALHLNDEVKFQGTLEISYKVF